MMSLFSQKMLLDTYDQAYGYRMGKCMSKHVNLNVKKIEH